MVEGKYNNRSYFQVTGQKETLTREFAADVRDALEYPFHFIDFETTQSAIPFNRGMRPYEKVLFQWSSHTMQSPGGQLSLGDTGTIMTRSSYENTQLAYLHRHLSDNSIIEPGLSAWLERNAKNDGRGGERIVDLNKVALNYYYHPLMGAKTSFIVTLPAVLSSAASSDRTRELLQAHDLYQLDQNGNIIDPYSLLPSIQSMDLADEPENSERVAEGTGAMIAYHKMIYGGLSPNEREIYREALLRYCSLDTLAMVLIWEYWADGK